MPGYGHTAIEVGVQHVTFNFIRFICQVNKAHAARLVPGYCHTAIEVGVQHVTFNFIRFICQVNKAHAVRLVPGYPGLWSRRLVLQVSAGLAPGYCHVIGI